MVVVRRECAVFFILYDWTRQEHRATDNHDGGGDNDSAKSDDENEDGDDGNEDGDAGDDDENDDENADETDADDDEHGEEDEDESADIEFFKILASKRAAREEDQKARQAQLAAEADRLRDELNVRNALWLYSKGEEMLSIHSVHVNC